MCPEAASVPEKVSWLSPDHPRNQRFEFRALIPQVFRFCDRRQRYPLRADMRPESELSLLLNSTASIAIFICVLPGQIILQILSGIRESECDSNSYNSLSAIVKESETLSQLEG